MFHKKPFCPSDCLFYQGPTVLWLKQKENEIDYDYKTRELKEKYLHDSKSSCLVWEYILYIFNPLVRA